MRRPVGTPDPAAFVGAAHSREHRQPRGILPLGTNVGTVMHYEPQATDHRQLFGRLAGSGLVRCDRGHSSRLVSDRLPVDPDNRLALPAPSHCCFGLAVLIAATRNRLVAATGAGFSVSTLGGYLLSLWTGLFNFKETRTTAGIVAG